MKRRKALRNLAITGGALVATTPLLTLLQSCKNQNRIDWNPSFLNEQQAEFISVMVDTILPATKTPGGLEMKVDMFIDSVFTNLYDEKGKENVVVEIERFEQGCRDKFGKIFAQLNSDEKKQILLDKEKESPKFNGSVWGTAVGTQEPVGFYRSLKSMMLWGYFTSEEIGKNVLSYDPIPQEYKGCIPLSDVGKIWSL